jgi:nicotinate-nucleotide pyrophosphorylase (carboxylating)
MLDLPLDIINDVVRRALAEDLGTGDITTLSVVPTEARAEALLVAREPGVIAGLPVVAAVYHQVDPQLVVVPLLTDGTTVVAGTHVARISGAARSLLIGERVALNLLQRLSGTATLTAQYVAAVAGTQARILDTRKTTPGLRALEKYAVRAGGGTNHRFGLYDAVMIKDNHLATLQADGASIAVAIQRARAKVGPLVKIEVEADTLEQARAAAEAGADVILLDNMPPALLRIAVQELRGRALLEASGGVNLSTVRAIAETGVDYISVGALTHSARALDIGLDWA